MKILNLYAGIGGNRKLWKGVEVTAVEINQEIAKVYQDFFPDDKVIVGDAHKYLLDHYREFDFIWSSPPCPTHSKVRYMMSGEGQQNKEVYPDMKLYEEIILLTHYFKGKWVVENVIAYYKPLIKPQELQRHHFWANFNMLKIRLGGDNIRNGTNETREENLDFDLTKYKGIDKTKILRNCVHPKLGLHIFNCAFKEKQVTLNYEMR